MFGQLKRFFYFPVASYFRFFAAIRLRRWNPRIILVTGSNGKTTLLHMLEAQIGDKAKYSHHANSSFGIPFDILDLHRDSLFSSEWIDLILKAPFMSLKRPPKEKMYVIEADCDRPGEGRFLAEFLQPEIVLWTSTARTHSMNFDQLVSFGRFNNVEEAIAYEYGYFLQYCSKMAVVDGDSQLEMKQVIRTKASVKEIKKEDLQKYDVIKTGTIFQIKNTRHSFDALLPEEVYLAIAMCKEAVSYLNISFDTSFAKFILPPGRGSLFAGVKNTTLIDSSYNANFSSMKAILEMYKKFPSKVKWAVIGDMLEQGNEEAEEHKKLATLLAEYDFDRIIFLGPRVTKYTYPTLQSLITDKISMNAFLNPREVLEFINAHIQGEEVILFKGARFMEGIIEHLLKDKKDTLRLPRREKVWQLRRKQWSL